MILLSITVHSYQLHPHTRSSVFSCARKLLRSSGLLLVIIAALAGGCAAQGNTWAWISGNKNANQAGVYGSQGLAGSENVPGARQDATLWADSGGKIWVFGGLGRDANSTLGYLNDLWVYDPVGQKWTWVSGSETVPGTGGGYPGRYGTLGQAAASNAPGGRSHAAGWSDAHGNIWLFGGLGYDSAGTPGELNDIWMFNTSTKQWTWNGGSPTVPASWSGVPGRYGTRGVGEDGNTPGGRSRSAACEGADGRFWLFGGSGVDASGKYSDDLNDLWSFDPTIRRWTWMGGSSTLPASGNIYGVYGTLGTPDSQNAPGGRFDASCWVDRDGNFWMFGGLGFLSDPLGAYLNDLWQFNPTSLQWAWTAGSRTTSNHDTDGNELHDLIGQPGSYGSLGVASAESIPGGRRRPSTWTDWSGNLWLYGGSGFDSVGHFGSLNDLWSLAPARAQWTWMGGDATIPKAPDCWSTDFYIDPCGHGGNYGSQGIATSDSHPGSRTDSSAAADPSGHFWLFGGNGFDDDGIDGGLNDFWRFVPDTATQTAPPMFSPPGGPYPRLQLVTLSDATPGATIYYTTDGSQPTTSSTVYQSPICVCSANPMMQPSFKMMIQAIAVSGGLPQSPVSWAYYVIDAGPPAAPSLTPPPGNFTGPVDVTITDPTVGAAISYSLGAGVWTPYKSPVHIATSTTLFATASYGTWTSLQSGGAYTISGPPAALPNFNPPAGTYSALQSVVISDSTPGATIYYTTDGSMPTTSSTPYSIPIVVGTSQTIQAIATAPGSSTSVVASATYTINLPPPGFTLGANPSSITVKSGSQGSVTLTITPQNGFVGVISFACSGQPAAVSCSFVPATLTPAGNAVTTQLTFTAGALAMERAPQRTPWLPTLALVGLTGAFWWRRRTLSRWILLALAVVALQWASACGGRSARTPVSATITITATSATLKQSTPIAFTLN